MVWVLSIPLQSPWYPRFGLPVVLGGAEPRGDPPCPALPVWLCSILPCCVRGAVMISLPSWAVARLHHDTPFPWHQAPLPCSRPHHPPRFGEHRGAGLQRDAELQGIPREAPMGPAPSPGGGPVTHGQATAVPKPLPGEAEPTPCFPPSFRLSPPQLQALSPPSHPSFITEPAVTHVQPHPPPASCSSRRCWG